jgi:hypothetical protein
VTNLVGIGHTPTAWTTWPNLATGQADEVDSDGDGYLGITAPVKTGGSYGYVLIPSSLIAGTPVYADQLFMELRSVLSLQGALTSCDAASGAATVADLDSHIIGCHIQGKGTDAGADYCTNSGLLDETSSLDGNRPVFVIGSATYEAKRLTTTTDCAGVLGLVP